MKFILIPGMGCYPTSQCNWYSWFEKEMMKRSHECIVRDFPDPYDCKESIWVPFVRNELGLDTDPKNIVLIGHSSGASCAMRIIEEQGRSNNNKPKIKGAILVATAYTDLGDPHEAASGYFHRPWEWEQIQNGCEKIILFHGIDDHLIPVEEARYIASQLGKNNNDNNNKDNEKGTNFQYIEMENMSHFFEPWQKLLDVIDEEFGGGMITTTTTTTTSSSSST